MIYLDYAAHTPPDPAVIDAFRAAAAADVGNPNSAHPAGADARRRLDAAVASMAGRLGVGADELVLTSGATESNNLAVKGAAMRYRAFGRHIVATMLEHSSVTGPLSFLQREGFDVDYAPLAPDGKIDLSALNGLLRDDTILVCVSAVDSEIGIRQPIGEIAKLVHARPRRLLHVDCTQAVGKLPVSFQNVDLASFSPHKFYGLCGSGLLFRRRSVMLEPQQLGGTADTPFRSGTPAVALAAAADAALGRALDAMPERLKRVRALNAELRDTLSAMPALRINTPPDGSPYLLNLSVAGGRGDALQKMLAENGVCVSTKSACCAPGTPSRPVYALTRDRRAALSTLRVSLSHLTTEDELGRLTELLGRGLS